MTEPRPAADDLMAARYGTRRSGQRRRIVAAVVVLGIGALVWLLWAAWWHATPEVQGELQTFDVVSDHEVTLVIDIRRESGTAVTCLLRAQADDHGLVGEQTVTIPAGASESLTFEASLVTDREAVTATVTGCRAAD